MKSMLAASLLAACWLLSPPVRAQAMPPAAPADESGIRAVIEEFRTAIIERDKARFARLFLEGPVTWQSVKSDEALRRIRTRNPQAQKARVLPGNGWQGFIDGIVAAKNASEEKFSNIRIDSDGDVASVNFDYSFHSDGRMTNSGRESWQLVRTEAGWRIVSVVWSVNLPPQD